MQPEKIAELTTQIVIALIESGKLDASVLDNVANYYAVIHQQILDNSKKATKEAQASFAGEAIEPVEDFR